MTSTTITLSAMRFHVRVGILDHERELPQPLEVDLTVRVVPARAGVLDYRTLYAIVSDIVCKAPLDYLEAAGERILNTTLETGAAEYVRVALRKPNVALDGPLAFAEVVVEGARG